MQRTAGNAKGARMAAALTGTLTKPLDPPYPLDPALRPIWDEIINRRARSEWNPIDLRFAWELTEVMGRIRDERQALKEEDMLVHTKSGPRVNPRLTGIRTLQNQQFELARYLLLHPASDTADAPKLTGNRKANREALAVMDPLKDDPSSRFLPLSTAA